MHSESVTALLYTINCYSVSFPIPCGHKVPIEVCKRSVGQAENIIKQERDGKSAALRQHAQPKSMSRTLKMDTLGIEPRASRMLSGCDTTTPCALEREGIVFAPNDKWPLQPTGVPRRLGKRKGQKTRIRGGGSWAESLRSHLAHQPTSQPAPRPSAPPLAPHPRQSGAGSVPA